MQPRSRPSRRTPLFAPLLALAGLVLVAVASYWGFSFLNSRVDDAAAAEAQASGELVGGVVSGAEPSESPGQVDAETPQPEATEEVAAPLVIRAPPGEGADLDGTILFSRGGDIWSASGRSELRALTDTKSTTTDSDPAWSEDGKAFYFIRTSQKTTDKTRPGGKYTLTPTDLMRAKADGSGIKMVHKSLIRDRRGYWFSYILQPSVSPNGDNIAVVSDGPDGDGEVILYVVNSKNGRIRRVPAPFKSKLGHNDPDFSPDGTRIAYTYNDNSGSSGEPHIGIWTCKSKTNCSQGKNKLMKSGYANPSWSPDAKWLAVEASSGTGRDIVIISARRGDVQAILTDDGNSFAPAVSPDGNHVAYLRRDGTDIDLRVMTLDIDSRGNITLVSDQAVTTDGGVDGEIQPQLVCPQEPNL